MTSSQTPTNRGLETCSGNHLHTGENVLCHHMTHMHGIMKGRGRGEITYARENSVFRKHRELGALNSIAPQGESKMSKEIKQVQAQIGGTNQPACERKQAQTPPLWAAAIVLHPQRRQTALDFTRVMAHPRGNTPEGQFPQTPRNRGL